MLQFLISCSYFVVTVQLCKFGIIVVCVVVDGTMFGLTLTYIITMLGVLQYVVRVSAEVESYVRYMFCIIILS